MHGILGAIELTIKNKNLGIIAALMTIAVIGVSVISYQTFQLETTTTNHETNTSDLKNSKMRGIGELYMLDYGSKVSPDVARSVTGFSNASTPPKIMKNLVLESVRIREYAESQMMTAFYVPSTITLKDLDTFENVMNNDGILVIFTEEKQSTAYDSQKWREDFVKAAPQVRKSDTINGYPTIVITGNPEKEIRSEILIYKDNLQIDIVSMKHNVDDLAVIAQLITLG